MQAAPVNLQQLIKLKSVCRDLVNDSKDIASLNELGHLVEGIDERLINAVQPLIFSVFYPMLKNIAKDKASYSNKEKEVIVEILSSLFKKSNINNISLFFNFYSFLLFELYDHLHHTVLEINEEYKLAIMKCTTNLAKSLASDLILTVYSKENAPKLCQMIYVAMEIAKNEKMRSLRVAAMECIMSLGRVLDDGELEDVVVGKSIAQVFLYFLPGLASGLKQIALEDEKVGHYVTQNIG